VGGRARRIAVGALVLGEVRVRVGLRVAHRPRALGEDLEVVGRRAAGREAGLVGRRVQPVVVAHRGEVGDAGAVVRAHDLAPHRELLDRSVVGLVARHRHELRPVADRVLDDLRQERHAVVVVPVLLAVVHEQVARPLGGRPGGGRSGRDGGRGREQQRGGCDRPRQA
jgi:hypothetical protein